MDLESNYEILRTADFIRSNNFTRVALQFPDKLLKDSTKVVRALRKELGVGVLLFVMADTAYGSCCVDEIGALRVESECVIHYGHACISHFNLSIHERNSQSSIVRGYKKLTVVVKIGTYFLGKTFRKEYSTVDIIEKLVLSKIEIPFFRKGLKRNYSRTTRLPAFYVFGKSSIDVIDFVQSLHRHLSTNSKPILVLFGLEYVHALQNIKAAMAVQLPSAGFSQAVQYADVTSSIINSSVDINRIYGLDTEAVAFNHGNKDESLKPINCNDLGSHARYGLGGLNWSIPMGHKVDEYLLIWIGSEDSAFLNVVLTFNNCEIVRYDPVGRQFLKDFPQKNILKRRYYLVEKAKDANIVGILVGTLAVAGYHKVINQMKELIEWSGKKSYTLLMGRPNAFKLANFPECDVFVYVSCAQTSLLDSKDFLAPVITPFEAMLAFSRGKEWTGEYVMEFGDLMIASPGGVKSHIQEARFSFIKGGYMEDAPQLHENEDQRNGECLALAESAKAALSLSGDPPSDSVLFKGMARSGVDFFSARSFKGIEMRCENPSPAPYIIGRHGRAASYDGEKNIQEKM